MVHQRAPDRSHLRAVRDGEADDAGGVGRFKFMPHHVLRPGDVCAGRYRVMRLLAAGGMAEVYEVFDDATGEYRALKTLQLRYRDKPEVTRRAEAEARTLLRMRHENLVRVGDAGVDGDTVYFVMELLQGCDLRAFLEHNGPLAPRVAVDLAYQLASAVGALHAIEVIHRDLKPDNAFISPRTGGGLHLKLLDLGAAKFYRDHVTTAVGYTPGTAQYLSPEQASGEDKPGPAADIYALGLILFELVSGFHPARLSPLEPYTLHDWTEWHRKPQKPRLDEAIPGAFLPLVRLVASCLAPLDQRLPNTSLLSDALAGLSQRLDAAGLGGEDHPASFPDATGERTAMGRKDRHQIAVASRITPQMPFARTEEQPRRDATPARHAPAPGPQAPAEAVKRPASPPVVASAAQASGRGPDSTPPAVASCHDDERATLRMEQAPDLEIFRVAARERPVAASEHAARRRPPGLLIAVLSGTALGVVIISANILVERSSSSSSPSVAATSTAAANPPVHAPASAPPSAPSAPSAESEPAPAAPVVLPSASSAPAATGARAGRPASGLPPPSAPSASASTSIPVARPGGATTPRRPEIPQRAPTARGVDLGDAEF